MVIGDRSPQVLLGAVRRRPRAPTAELWTPSSILDRSASLGFQRCPSSKASPGGETVQEMVDSHPLQRLTSAAAVGTSTITRGGRSDVHWTATTTSIALATPLAWRAEVSLGAAPTMVGRALGQTTIPECTIVSAAVKGTASVLTPRGTLQASVPLCPRAAMCISSLSSSCSRIAAPWVGASTAAHSLLMVAMAQAAVSPPCGFSFQRGEHFSLTGPTARSSGRPGSRDVGLMIAIMWPAKGPGQVLAASTAGP